jgi:hypothetical protein
MVLKPAIWESPWAFPALARRRWRGFQQRLLEVHRGRILQTSLATSSMISIAISARFAAIGFVVSNQAIIKELIDDSNAAKDAQ